MIGRGTFETWSAAERRDAQWKRLAGKLPELRRENPFYRAKLSDRASGLSDLPFTTKIELTADQAAHPPFGTNLTYPIERYVRLHQTSGTTGRPLRFLDTAESWEWWRECWDPIYRAAGVTASDRIFFAFSFGPFVGFWSAFAGAERLGALCLTGGAMSTTERVAAISATEATVVMCTPTYALRLAEAAREEGIDLARSALRVSIHAGEPGASIPATRERIEKELGVESFDHTGATEVGAHGFSCSSRDGVHINESEFIVEVIGTDGEVRDEGDGELVLTNLGRWCMPIIRYRTGDRVHATRGTCSSGPTRVNLAGGIAGRVDDTVRAGRGRRRSRNGHRGPRLRDDRDAVRRRRLGSYRPDPAARASCRRGRSRRHRGARPPCRPVAGRPRIGDVEAREYLSHVPRAHHAESADSHLLRVA